LFGHQISERFLVPKRSSLPVQVAHEIRNKQNVRGDKVPFDAMPAGGPEGRSCKACRQPIWPGQPTTHIEFQNDPTGTLGLTGAYHQPCGKRYLSLARVVNMKPPGRS
jgi:hypothetical protein